jgi:hypothetical protein
LIHLWPLYFGYVISVGVIGIMCATTVTNLIDCGGVLVRPVHVDGGVLCLDVVNLTATLLSFVHVALSLTIVVGLAVLYMLPRAGTHRAATEH